LHSYNLITELW